MCLKGIFNFFDKEVNIDLSALPANLYWIKVGELCEGCCEAFNSRSRRSHNIQIISKFQIPRTGCSLRLPLSDHQNILTEDFGSFWMFASAPPSEAKYASFGERSPLSDHQNIQNEDFGSFLDVRFDYRSATI